MSAPMTEVTALVACDWDIEAAQKELRKRGVALASKKSSRTAAEGFLHWLSIKRRRSLLNLTEK